MITLETVCKCVTLGCAVIYLCSYFVFGAVEMVLVRFNIRENGRSTQLALNVNPQDEEVREMKRRIEREYGYPTLRQVFTLRGQKLFNTDVLNYCNFRKGDEIDVDIIQEAINTDLIRIFVKYVDRPLVKIKISPSATARELMEKLQLKEEDFIIYPGGMRSTDTLNSVGIHEDSVIYLIRRCVGGTENVVL